VDKLQINSSQENTDLERQELKACLSLFASDESKLNKALEVEKWCADQGARILFPGHADYPFDPYSVEENPKFISCWGGSPWRSAPSIAVVGSREPSNAATDWLEIHLAEFLSRTKAVVVSGGARGVDQRAHFIAVRAGLPTVVFLPSGLGHLYPSEWQTWKKDVIATGGAIISTYSPFQEVRRSHFEDRNRLIAALGKMIFVVEARRRSGSSMTARLAREMDRTICCLPGSPMDPRCAGTIDLLFDGAFPVRDAGDLEVLFAMNAVGG
jgi:DNA processing protein